MRIEYLCVRESRDQEILERCAAIYWDESNPKDDALAQIVVGMAVDKYGAYGGDGGDAYITVHSRDEYDDVKDWYKITKKKAIERIKENTD